MNGRGRKGVGREGVWGRAARRLLAAFLGSMMRIERMGRVRVLTSFLEAKSTPQRALKASFNVHGNDLDGNDHEVNDHEGRNDRE